MLNTVNQIRLEGNLGNNPKLIETDKTTFIELSVATDKPIAVKEDGTLKTITEWHKVLIFDAEMIEQIEKFGLKKGSKVRVDGALDYRKRQIKDTNGEVVATVKEASVIAGRVLPL